MNTRMVIVGAAVVVLIVTGWLALSYQNAKDDAMMKEADAAAQKEMETIKGEGAMSAEADAADTMVKKGSYESYAPEKVAAAGNSKVLLFFHAEWCPICRPLDAAIKANLSGIPSDVVILKVNYDEEIALRQKYGVTYQHTIVEVDSGGRMIKKWSASIPTFAALIAEIK